MERLEDDIYTRCLSVAKSYYRLLRRNKEIESDIILSGNSGMDGMPHGQSVDNPTADKATRIYDKKQENERKIKAVEQAWSEMIDDCERALIKKNLFERIPMQYIDLPMSIITMKRVRKKFLVALAINLHEI